MAFPQVPRVIYRQNPLAEVVCHFSFPPILKIDLEPPAVFQDLIRAHYPVYASAPLASVQFTANLPPALRPVVEGLQPVRNAGLRHEFASEDKKWQIVLTRDSLALKATEYRRWEQFREHFARIFESLVHTYAPAFYVRVGLQYHDVIKRSKLGLVDIPWRELIESRIAGELSVPEIGDRIDRMERQLHLRLDGDDQFLHLRVWIAPDAATQEQCFVINAAFHTHGKKEQAHVLSTLDDFNRMGGFFFRWCIRDRLHQALQPDPVV